jgi:hypothetical protein
MGRYGFFRADFQRFMGRNPMWISGLWYGFRAYLVNPNAMKPIPMGGSRRLIKSKSVLMRKTIVFNLLLILGYYFILQILVWLAMIFR